MQGRDDEMQGTHCATPASILFLLPSLREITVSSFTVSHRHLLYIASRFVTSTLVVAYVSNFTAKHLLRRTEAFLMFRKQWVRRKEAPCAILNSKFLTRVRANQSQFLVSTAHEYYLLLFESVPHSLLSANRRAY